MSFRNRRNFRSSISPINRHKHVIDVQNAVIAGVTATESLINTVDSPVLGTSVQVKTASKVNGIYLHVEVVATTSAALSNVYLIVFKNPGNNLVIPNPNVVGINDNKKYVIHQEMVMLQQQTNSNPRTLFNGVIVIPKGYRRNGPNDRIGLKILAPGVNINYCIQCHYKEFQ